MARRAEDWRRRLTGRKSFDRAAAEAAIGAAYQAAGLAAPGRILWARGPGEAIGLLRFLAAPPRRQRRLGQGLAAAGALIWAALAFVIAGPAPPDQSHGLVAIVAALLAFYLVREGTKALPPPPGMTVAPQRGAAALIEGPAVFAAMIGVLLALHDTAPEAGFAAGAAGPAMAAAAGALPGALLLRRLRRIYGAVPAEVRELNAGRSVARPLLRARWRALGPGAAFPAVHPYEPLVRAYQSAYGDAVGRAEELLWDGGRVHGDPDAWRRADAGWVATAPRSLTDWSVLLPVPHLDGVAEAPMLQAADGRRPRRAQAFADLAFHVDRLFPYRNLALAVRPPIYVSLDADGRPHAEGGPALSWADGSELHAWRGRVVDRDLVYARPITPALIRAEREPDRQAVLIERYGLGRYLSESGATAIQSDSCGDLYRLHQRGEPIVAVRVVNASAEPDGSLREFWLRVPPTVRTAREAVAWTFGLSEQEYEPIAQS